MQSRTPKPKPKPIPLPPETGYPAPMPSSPVPTSPIPPVSSGQRAPMAISQPGPPATPNTLGVLRVDLPMSVQVNEPFSLDLWLQPVDRSFSGTVGVFMEQTHKMIYEPRTFNLRAGARQTVRARVLKSRSGLAEVIASANGWDDLYVTLDAGFSAKLKASQLGQPLESGTAQTFTFDFVDSLGKPLPLDAPVKLMVSASKAKLKWRPEFPASERIEVDIARGATSTPPIEVTPQALAPDKGILLVDVKINNDFVILNEGIQFTILPRWWVPMLMAVLGGVLHGLYQIVRDLAAAEKLLRRRIARAFGSLVTSGLAGALAYFLSNFDVLGIKIDTSSLRGFVILGFLFSYVGIDLILKTLVPTKK